MATQRVITHLGFGKVVEGRGDPFMATVELDQPFLGKRQQPMQRNEVFDWGGWALVRVLNVSGVGIFSTMQFYESEDLARTALGLPAPPDETRFLIDLASGAFTTNQRLMTDEGCQIVEPYVDRWGREANTLLYETAEAGVACFDEDLARMAGATGIWSMILLDLEQKKLLRLAIIIATPQGVVYNWSAPKTLPPRE